MSENTTEIDTSNAVGGQLDAIVMRRELKFRVWDLDKKKMLFFGGIFNI